MHINRRCTALVVLQLQMSGRNDSWSRYDGELPTACRLATGMGLQSAGTRLSSLSVTVRYGLRRAVKNASGPKSRRSFWIIDSALSSSLMETFFSVYGGLKVLEEERCRETADVRSIAPER